MKTAKVLMKTVAIILTLLLAMTSVNLTGILTVLAAEQEKLTTEIASDSADSEVEYLREIESERTEDSTTYLNTDGTKTQLFYGSPIRYKDETMGRHRQLH